MTAGCQGHPGWVDNHPTSLKFLAASQVSLNPYSFCSPMTSVASEETPPTSNSSAVAVPYESPDVFTPSISEDEDQMMEVLYSENFTSQLPSLQYASKSETESKRCLNIRPDIFIPQNISEYILHTAVTNYPFAINSQFISLFRNTRHCKLCKVYLRSTEITIHSIRMLLNHKLTHLDIRDCENLTSRVWQEINDRGKDLSYLAASKSVLPDERKQCVLALPLLKELILTNIDAHCSYFNTLLRNLRNLAHLNLSECQKLDNLEAIENLNLIGLFLYNSVYEEEAIQTVCRIETLR